MHISTLNCLWQKWFDLYSSLSAKQEYANHLAGLFVGHVPADFAVQQTKILYVGKATRGQFKSVTDSSDDRTDFDQTFQLHQNYAADLFAGLSCGAFWPFADKISKQMGSDSRSNLAWTNLCKIGMTTKNPSAKLIAEQKVLATLTLRAEIESYRPTLVVLVTNNFARDILLEAVDGQDLASWTKSEMEASKRVDGIWWRPASPSFPALLWMRHPQGATREELDYAIEKMCEIT